MTTVIKDIKMDISAIVIFKTGIEDITDNNTGEYRYQSINFYTFYLFMRIDFCLSVVDKSRANY